MATRNFPISLTLKAIDKATAPLRKINQQVAGLERAAKRAAKAGLALTAGVTTPLAAIGATSVAAATKFEEGMANVATLIDTNVESIQEMSDRVLEMGRVMPVPLEQLSAGLAEARGAGVSAADQFRVLEGSTKLAIVGLGEVGEAVDIVTSAMNAFNLHGEESEQIYNAVFQATNVGKATISQLAQGFGSVAGVVANAGVSLEEYMAAVAALTTTGLPAAEAHTQLRAVIAGLMKDSELTRRVFKHLGAKDMKELIMQSGGLVPALERVRTALRNDDTQMKNLLGSVIAFNATVGLTGAQSDAFYEALQLMEEGGETFEAKYVERTQTLRMQTQRLRNAFESIQITVGGALVPTLERLIPPIERAAAWWESLNPGTQQALILFGAIAATLGPALVALSGLSYGLGAAAGAISWAAGWGKYLWMMRASIMAGLIPSLTAAISSTWAFTAALLANPITWVVAAIAAAAYLIYRNWEPISLFFRFLWEDITELFTAALGFVKEHMAWSPLGLILNHWGPITEFFEGLWGGVVETFTWAWEHIQRVVGWVGDAISSTPLGWAIGKISDLMDTGKIGDAVIWGGGGPELGAERVAQGGANRSESYMSVEFANAPPGTRVREARSSGAELDWNMGWSMLTP